MVGQNAQELEGRLLDAREWRDPIKLAAIPILGQSHAINHRCVLMSASMCRHTRTCVSPQQ
jgi:hypothetical protein